MSSCRVILKSGKRSCTSCVASLCLWREWLSCLCQSVTTIILLCTGGGGMYTLGCMDGTCLIPRLSHVRTYIYMCDLR